MVSKLKRQPRETNTAPVTVTLPVDILTQIDTLADLHGETRSLVIADMLAAQLAR